ncbi:MAG TPA: hypothetical protein VLY84_06210 [Dysgonamonadaceae bacterium]|nr:hypothetical protein [Dysgonamonadaceae bacterium]
MELISKNTGNWEIYRMIDKETSEAYIIRFPKLNLGGTKIHSYINNFETINKIGISTLRIVEEFNYEGKKGIRTEDLNYRKEYIYVTYNSLYSDEQKMIDSLNPYIKTDENKKSPEYEEFRYRNKLKDITNFEEFIKVVKNDLILATKKDILIDFDSYFFGSKKSSDISTIDYKIVDLDNICTNTGKTQKELLNDNISEFKRAIKGFIKYFVILDNQHIYEQYLDKIF